MKKQIINLSLIFMVLTGVLNYPKATNPNTEKTFKVTIEQNGTQQEIKNNSVVLNRRTFDIVIEFSEPMALLVNASFNKKTFNQASKNIHLDKLPGFQETGMAEGYFNTEKQLFLAYKAPNYWYYDSDDDNRFNIVDKTDHGIICKRTIENLYDIDTKTSIKTKEIDKPLYLVFISYKRGENITDRIEVQRQYFKVKWSE